MRCDAPARARHVPSCAHWAAGSAARGRQRRAARWPGRLPSRHHLRGYSYFSSASEAARPRHHQRAASHSGSYRRAGRARERRCCSALGAPARRRLGSRGRFRRVAVSVSCSALRERRCISTSPAATMRRPLSCARLDHRGSASSPGAAAARARSRRRAVVEPGLQPHRLVEQGLEALRASGSNSAKQARQAGEEGCVGHVTFDIAACAKYSPARAPRHGDPVRQVAVAAATASSTRRAPDVGASARRRSRRGSGCGDADFMIRCMPSALARLRRAHHAGERAFVGEASAM